MPTIRDVAKLAGVSVATVSRVLNQNGYLTKSTELKVRESIEKLNFTPNRVARGLAQKKTYTIALIIPDIMNPFFPELARAVEDTANEIGYTLFLCNSDSRRDKEIEYLEVLKNRYVDGIIIGSGRIERIEMDLKIPIVSLDRAADSLEVTSVKINNYSGAVLAVKHLLSIGCTNIAYLGGPRYVNTSIERQRGYVEALCRENRFNPSYMAEGDFSFESGLLLTEQLIHSYPEIDGIFTANDMMAIGALKSLLRMGRKVPEDVALVGFDGIELTRLVEPEITTVAQPIYELGKRAVLQLAKQMESKESGTVMSSEELEVELIQRATTRR